MTRIAYIVSAYKLPAQLERLLRRLDGPGVSLAVHVDRKAARAVYDEMVARTRDLDVHFLPRHVSHWGGFGHVQATLKGIDHVVSEQIPFDYVVLLTGQDYPLRPATTIADELGASGGRSFMSHWRLPYPPW
ncbi:MAG: beta-1,6-N-acetylglucosaminyltransferase, partial [Thermoleophilia bacterium]|nr:beta-1,6-N-acetylglucosaminyltransferase [Thermoleophilia bacterium]